ncbi:TetR/AcrR family transcriptional regulator [Tardiphaga sp.]|jgi:AcrR family transcriptional regulator|uniref:TetR/AcrR family transcriptional regulator n=1 Tax=Tardiphaga sp. TaxID=1926292 RepID=UPI0037D998A9
MSDIKPIRRGRPRSVETEEAILDSAYRMMAIDGLTAATIDAIARESGVSKMTIYKWWPSREALLIDAFLKQAASMLPIPESGDAIARISRHAAAYAAALSGEFGKVQLAVIAECIARTGSARMFSERYLGARRDITVAIIKAGQKDGCVTSPEPATDLYDRIYGTLFYQDAFGFRAVTADHARKLVKSVLSGA